MNFSAIVVQIDMQSLPSIFSVILSLYNSFLACSQAQPSQFWLFQGP